MYAVCSCSKNISLDAVCKCASTALTCRKAALASNASVDSVAMETSAVGVPAAGMDEGERRGVEVRENSSGGAPSAKTLGRSVKYEKSHQCIWANCAAVWNQTMFCTKYANTGCHVFCQQNVIWFLSCLLPCCGKLTPVAWASRTRYMSLCLAMDSVILTCWLRWSFRDSSSVWALFKLCSSSPRLITVHTS